MRAAQRGCLPRVRCLERAQQAPGSFVSTSLTLSKRCKRAKRYRMHKQLDVRLPTALPSAPSAVCAARAPHSINYQGFRGEPQRILLVDTSRAASLYENPEGSDTVPPSPRYRRHAPARGVARERRGGRSCCRGASRACEREMLENQHATRNHDSQTQCQ